MIRPVTLEDAAAIADIYNYYILHSTITFEEEALVPAEMARRIQSIATRFPWLVYESEGDIWGYAYATDWRTRSAYKHTVETTVYLKHDATYKGVGSALYAALLQELRARNMHAIIGGIALPNEASVRLHEKFGFVKVAHFKDVGYKFGQWLDVGYWELLL